MSKEEPVELFADWKKNLIQGQLKLPTETKDKMHTSIFSDQKPPMNNKTLLGFNTKVGLSVAIVDGIYKQANTLGFLQQSYWTKRADTSADSMHNKRKGMSSQSSDNLPSKKAKKEEKDLTKGQRCGNRPSRQIGGTLR